MKMERRDIGEVEALRALNAAARLISSARHLSVFTGAGISVESGIPAFRGENGIWNSYDPRMLELEYFLRYPDECWPVIKEIFYDFFTAAQPNEAHGILARWEREGRLKTLVTQNIDDLHTRAGNLNVIEYHGNSRKLRCLSCTSVFGAAPDLLSSLPPKCTCGGLLKPDFIFFGEGISYPTAESAERAMYRTDVLIIIGSTGEVYPAAALPEKAKRNGALVIEINPSPSNFTGTVTDIHIRENAVAGMKALDRLIMNGGTG